MRHPNLFQVKRQKMLPYSTFFVSYYALNIQFRSLFHQIQNKNKTCVFLRFLEKIEICENCESAIGARQ